MTEPELLKAARALIAAQPSVPRGAVARDARGRPCDVIDNPLAVRFCAVGALAKIAQYDSDVFGGPVHTQAYQLLDKAAEVRGFTGIVHLNDSRGRTAVLQAYDAAITELEATP